MVISSLDYRANEYKGSYCYLPTPPKSSSESSGKVDHTKEFHGEVKTNNTLPTQKTLKMIENLPLLDEHGYTLSFKDIITGFQTTRRVLVIFIRHFFCGNCQEYIRSLTSSIYPADLQALSTTTSIAIIGCGSPSLIPMYRAETGCPFRIYSDPTRKVYDGLGMLRTLNLGARPDYQRVQLLSLITRSLVQSLRKIKTGDIFKGGDIQQVGGEFLFEPINFSILGISDEDKMVSWCHRMRNTRDHAGIPELREVLGLERERDFRGADERRWLTRGLQLKGTNLSWESTNDFSR